MRALSIAATGMSAQQLNVEVIANNLANSNTTGFKRSMPQFADLLYQTEKSAGTPSRSGGDPIPEAMQIGLGVQAIGIEKLVNIQGPLTQTHNQLDLALNGRGWFQVSGPNNVTLYTRAGNFVLNATGQIVTQDGSALIPNMTIQPTTAKISVTQDGQVAADGKVIGQISIAIFPNDGGLTALGNNMFQETTSSGSPLVAYPNTVGYGYVQQGWLESSNVDPVLEITNLILAQRNYEMNSKVIQASDEMYQVITKNNL
jgi:flagellar basal-body rod protein FlgG